MPNAFLSFLFLPYFSANASSSASRSALHAWAAFFDSCSAAGSAFAMHAFMAFDVLLAP